MSDRPILFSAAMVRALLDGRKTQTRRVVNPQPLADGYYDGEIDCTVVPARDAQDSTCFRFGASAVGGGAIRTEVYQPHYVPGDRLWVREAHAILPASAYRGSVGTGTIAQTEHPTDGYSAAVFREGFDRSGEPRWRPSIHMPRWASRLTLTVTDVRVQRLQDISEADAVAEGIHPYDGIDPDCHGFKNYRNGTADGHWLSGVDSFRTLWDSLNADRAPWASNPWVCAVSFEVHRGNIDQMEAP